MMTLFMMLVRTMGERAVDGVTRMDLPRDYEPDFRIREAVQAEKGSFEFDSKELCTVQTYYLAPERLEAAAALLAPLDAIQEEGEFQRLLADHVARAQAAGTGVAWEIRTPKPCRCVLWEQGSSYYTDSFPDDELETLESRVTGDYHGATPHEGRLRCRACNATFSYVANLHSTSVTRE